MVALILSTGNVYFTSNDASGAHVYRTGQTSSPGQEIELYREPLGSLFGDITFAEVDGQYFGYFFASSGGDITIKRVPLTGAQFADVLTPPINDIDILNTHHNLISDGQFLYWQQATAMQKMSVNGGEIVMLDPCDPNTPTAGVYLHNDEILYASVYAIRHVPKTGAITIPQVRTYARANARVLSMTTAVGDIYWGDNNGAIQVLRNGSVLPVKDNSPLLVTSLGTNLDGNIAGVILLWLECNGIGCQIRVNTNQYELVQPIGLNPLGAGMNNSGDVFWGDALGVHRLHI